MSLPIPKQFINELLNQCDITTLIVHFIPLHKQGKNYEAHCPFHQEKTPSFKVYTHSQLYHCFGCGAHGNAIQFIQSYQKLDFLSAVEWLAGYANIPIPKSVQSYHKSNTDHLYQILKDAVAFYRFQLKNNEPAALYLKKRSLSEKSIEKFQIGLSLDKWDHLFKFLTDKKAYHPVEIEKTGLIIQTSQKKYYDRFRNRIIFPICDQRGRVIGLGGRLLPNVSSDFRNPKYLNSPETLLFRKSHALYGLYEAVQISRTIDRICVVEGYMDVISLQQGGIPHVVATLGTALSRTHLQHLFRYTKEVVFFFDGDEAGKKAAVKAMELSLTNLQDDWNIGFILLSNQQDPDNWINHSSNQNNLDALLAQVISLSDFFFQQIQINTQLDTVEGKTQLIQKALFFLKKMPFGIMRQQLINTLARMTRTHIDILQKLIVNQKNKNYDRSIVNSKSINVYSPQNCAIGLLLQYPQVLAPQLDSKLICSIPSNFSMLIQLVKRVQNNLNIHSSTLLEQFKNTDHYNDLLELAYHDWLIPPEGVFFEFQGLIKHLIKLDRENKIQILLHKAQKSTLTQAEKSTLAQLIQKKL